MPFRTILLIVTMLLLNLVACGERTEPLPTPDPTVIAPLVDTSYAGTLQAINGETRDVSLLLSTDVEGDYVFSLDYLFVGRTTAPTNRTGNWFYDGSSITLVIEEQDGEPVDQPSLVFAQSDNKLLATIFDKNHFDVDSFLLERLP